MAKSTDDAVRFSGCAGATDVPGACVGLADDLHRRWALPSIYLLIDGRLRCQASRGYFQVSDGFAPSTGVIGRVVRAGRAELIEDVSREPDFVAAIPGLASEICVPVIVCGRTAGAVNIESRTRLDRAAVVEIERAAAFLGARITELGGLPEPSLADRLARVAIDLAGLTSLDEVYRVATAGACAISGMSSAAIVTARGGGWSVSHAHGPLAPVLYDWDASVLDALSRWVGPGVSSYVADGRQAPTGHDFLGAALQALAVQPLEVAGRVAGLLVTADGRTAAHDPGSTLTMELLALQTAATLATVSMLEDLVHQAAHDPLTGLTNRRRLLEAMDDGPGDGWALVLLDLDGFKAVNDEHGHSRGDDVLVEVAHRLRSVAGPDDVVCRLGGDEFAVLARLDGGADLAQALGERFVGAVLHGDGTGGRPAVGASAGVRVMVGGSASTVLVDADVALYAAKKAGRGSTVVWEPALRQRDLDQAALVRDLREALSGEGLSLVYQPVVDLCTGRVRGLEALARWRHPRRGDVPPAHFVEAAEDAGMVAELSRWVLRAAFREAATWPPSADGACINIAVNISAAQLVDDRIVRDVGDALRGAHLTPSRVVVEVTETAQVVDLERAATTLHALSALGIGLALDDFGTGFSSLTHAQVLPYDILKVDRSFVMASAAGDRRATATIAAVCVLATGMEVDVVAEGIETEAQVARLLELGCRYGQGYALSRPLSVEVLHRALRHQGLTGWTLHARVDRAGVA